MRTVLREIAVYLTGLAIITIPAAISYTLIHYLPTLTGIFVASVYVGYATWWCIGTMFTSYRITFEGKKFRGPILIGGHEHFRYGKYGMIVVYRKGHALVVYR